ncbi:MAG: trypsin-like peptidase domain-containing protein [Coriobacteriia bacterium]|nr:trypsin-like peptidase domain-containing protein [Coriobacteriia bacterium]
MENTGIPGSDPVHQSTTPAEATFHAPVDPTPAPLAAPAASPRRTHSLLLIVAVVFVALLAGAIAGLAGGYAAYRFAPAQESSRQIELVGDQTEEVVAAAASVALPSVVNVDVTGEQADSGSLPREHPSVPIQGEGSGVAYQEAPDGGTYIITNNHVIDGATAIVVTDSAGERHDAELVGGDSESDIAVIKVAAPIPTIGIGDSENLVVGQLAIAIGSPFGLEHSVTSGVVSAVHRPLTNIGDSDGRYPYVDSIQTDAAINPGNSGGALVDRRGLLIGIPSAIYSDTGSYDGVGLAIPVQTAVRAAGELIEKGRVDTPFLGILGQTVTPAFAEQEGLSVTEGAWVAEVTAGAEAEKAGLQTGDVIVALDDARIRSMDDLILTVRRQSVGDEVSLTIWRDGDEMTIEMMIGIKPQDLTTE